MNIFICLKHFSIKNQILFTLQKAFLNFLKKVSFEKNQYIQETLFSISFFNECDFIVECETVIILYNLFLALISWLVIFAHSIPIAQFAKLIIIVQYFRTILLVFKNNCHEKDKRFDANGRSLQTN